LGEGQGEGLSIADCQLLIFDLKGDAGFSICNRQSEIGNA
jgi:hypothetical protein